MILIIGDIVCIIIKALLARSMMIAITTIIVIINARWAFRMYDKDNSGEIDLDEMVEIFVLMYAIQVTP